MDDGRKKDREGRGGAYGGVTGHCNVQRRQLDLDEVLRFFFKCSILNEMSRHLFGLCQQRRGNFSVVQTPTTDRRTGSEYTTNTVAYCLDRSGVAGAEAATEEG